ncbi:DUF3800 domain-containing protein [Hahella sp. CCB-MM4]|uniref:DUF3800 domain-containing protein n=1 Tax=Hahella sp. (strain CCB-MM4) TaxID=1926491 RepID=UPI00143DC57F|nr:DUF3800 domain-containing protein [Hahella sp. CCB-MM4]
MYVDESGDSGLVGSPTRYFCLSGLVIHELRWNEYLDKLIDFRKRMRNSFGLLMREEIHSAHLINKPGDLVRIKRNDRLTIIRAFINEIAAFQDISIINIVVDKTNKPADYDVMNKAWEALIQRFSNTMSRRNFPGPANPDERGMIIPDDTDAKKIQQLLRKMRKYNPIPNQAIYGQGYRNLTIGNLVEDPFFKDSRSSYLIQAADVVAFALYQRQSPSSYMKKKSGHKYFNRLNGILCKAASTNDPEGIVRL